MVLYPSKYASAKPLPVPYLIHEVDVTSYTCIRAVWPVLGALDFVVLNSLTAIFLKAKRLLLPVVPVEILLLDQNTVSVEGKHLPVM